MNVPIRPLSRAEVRALDVQAARDLALPTLILMENAGRGAAAWLAQLMGVLTPESAGRIFAPASPAPQNPTPRPLPRVLIVCGPGSNGGDGAVVARHLDAWGFPTRVIWFTRVDHLQGDAATQWSILSNSGINQSAWFDTHPDDDASLATELTTLFTEEADWLVDGLFGTGLSRPVEGPLQTVITAMNRSAKPIFALDLPSGLDADTGQPLGGTAVRAAATATFVAPKQGFTASGADQYIGQVAIFDIGVPRRLLEPYIMG